MIEKCWRTGYLVGISIAQLPRSETPMRAPFRERPPGHRRPFDFELSMADFAEGLR
jgi:hypothetical protein